MTFNPLTFSGQLSFVVSPIQMHTSFRSSWCYTASRWCVVVTALFACLGLLHAFALFKSQLREAFLIVNARTIHNIQLINFVDGHREWAFAYMALLLTVLVFCSWRRYPAWASWLWFCLLGAPCLMYLNVCAYISGKLFGTLG